MNCVVCETPTKEILELVWQCPDCSHIFRDVDCHQEFYETGEYRKTHPIQDPALRMPWIQNLLSFGIYPNNDQTFLEVGAGDGLFCQILLQLGKTITACELDPFIVKNYDGRIPVLVGDFLKMDLPEVDVVCAFDVVEHFKDPNPFFKKVKNKLFIQVPTHRRILSPKEFKDTHYHYFSEQSMRLMAEKHSFIITRMFQSGFKFTANGPELLVCMERPQAIMG